MKARNWTLRSLASAALLAASASGAIAQPAITPAAQTAAPAKLAAVVNGEPIPMEDVERFFKERPIPPQLTEEQRRQIKLEVVGMLVDDHLLQQFLKSNAPPAKEADINKWFVELEAGLKSQGHTLKEFYVERGLTEAQVRKNVSNMLQWVGYVNGKISDQELKQYYEANKDFFDQVSVHASHILIRVAPTASDADRQAVRTQLLGLRVQIMGGKLDFAEAAKKHSQCPSKAQGGDLGFFPRKFAVDENFARAAFALKVGEVSDIVQTDIGLHLIKVLDRKAGQPSSFEKIKDEVREVASEEMRQKLLAEQRKKSKIEILVDAPTLKAPGAN
jgi:peptidyl-prolyl cis-trans isomerase C